MEIKKILPSHYQQIAEIYLEGIATGNATFQIETPEWETWNKDHLPNCRIGAFENNEMAGWAAVSPTSNRCIYSGVAEVSIYIASNYRGKGIGKNLLLQLIRESEQQGLWTLQSGIFTENVSSIRLHEKCGFRQVGYREKIGKLNGIWRDIVLMERRSKIIGV